MRLPLSYNFTRLGVPKSFSYAQSRRSGKPPWLVKPRSLSAHLTASAVVGHYTQAKENSMSL